MNKIIATLALAFFIISCTKNDENDGGSINAANVKDIDGNTYTTIKIGSQVWMKENLKTTKYRNGDAIAGGLSFTQWKNTIDGAWAFCNNDVQYNNLYGKLYNWYAVADPRGVCPSGWHVPSEQEWDTLVDYLGGKIVAGGMMKTTGDLQSGTGEWDSPNIAATNSSGFSGLPGGGRGFSSVDFGDFSGVGAWWSSTEYSSPPVTAGWNRKLINDESEIISDWESKSLGYSVRCIKD